MIKMAILQPDFADIRLRGEFYSDKTGLLCDMAKQGVDMAKWHGVTYYLFRPRGFGKTLLVSTFEYILRGREDLFKGLEIERRGWDWTPRPVIKLEMGAISSESNEEMEAALQGELIRIAKGEEIDLDGRLPSASMLSELKASLYRKYKERVAILIDDCYAPVSRHINDPKKAEAVLRSLGDFYGVLKDQGEDRGLVLMIGENQFPTGTDFSHFSGNRDLTTDIWCAEICGLTEADLSKLIASHKGTMLRSLVEKGSLAKGATEADLRRLIKEFYGGYSWDGETRVYNPLSVLSCIKEAMISSYWYDVGLPNFMNELIKSREIDLDITHYIYDIHDMNDRDFIIDIHDKISFKGLLLQNGYLTIDNNSFLSRLFSVRFPNLEVSANLSPLLLNISPPDDPIAAKRYADSTFKALLEVNAPEFEKAFRGFLEAFSNRIFNIRSEEKYYKLLLLCMHIASHTSEEFGLIFRKKHYFNIDIQNTHYFIEVKLLSLNGDKDSDHYIDDNSDRGNCDDGRPLGEMEAAIQAKAAKSKSKSEPPLPPEERATLRKKAVPLAKSSLKRIERVFGPASDWAPDRLIKVALVVAKRVEIFVQMEDSGPRRP